MLKELYAKIKDLKAKAQVLVDSEGAEMTEEQEKEFNGYMSEIENAQNKIEKLEKLEKIQDFENKSLEPVATKTQQVIVQ